MPTFKEDLHLGHEVSLVNTDDIDNHAITEEKMADNSVSTRTIQDEAVTPEKLNPSVKQTIVDPEVERLEGSIEQLQNKDAELQRKDEDLQNQIDGIEASGVAVSNEFGNDPHISISQKKLTENKESQDAAIASLDERATALEQRLANEFGSSTTKSVSQKLVTEAINSIWNAISDITGQVHQGFSLSITPPYYIGEQGSDVLITAVPAPEFGHFESLKLYLNGGLISEYGQVDYLEKLIHIDEESTIKCEAKIMGVVYEEQKTIKHYSSFWIGAGETYESVIEQTPTPIGEDMRGSYDITVSETGQHIIVIVGGNLSGYIRADMNGFEIPMTLSDSPIVVGGKSYNVYTSDNVYAAGTYNIDING